MLKKLASVSGFTLLSRLTGFVRDMVLAWTLGSGILSDAFFVAFIFPNNFRAIFGEGTINPAFLPRYAALRAKGEDKAAAKFANEIFAWQMTAQIVLLVLATIFMPQIIGVLASGWGGDPQARADGPAGAHHLSLSDPDPGGRAVVGDAKRHREILGRRRLVEFPELGDDRNPAGLALVSQRRLCRGLGRDPGRRGQLIFILWAGAREGLWLSFTCPRWSPEIKNSSRPLAR